MLSNRYKYKSTLLRDRYIEGAISYDEYMSSLKAAGDEELDSIYHFERATRAAEIYAFETQQIKIARQTITRNEEEERKALAREKKLKNKRKSLKKNKKDSNYLPQNKSSIWKEKNIIKTKYVASLMSTKGNPGDIGIFTTGFNGASLLAQR